MKHQPASYKPENYSEKLLTLKGHIELRESGKISNRTIVLDIESGFSDSLSNILRANRMGKKNTWAKIHF